LSRRTIIEPLRLDILAAETIGTANDGALEALLNANPGMADDGPFLDAPKEIEIPARPEKPAVATVNPWE
jgi:phage tail protein X